MGWLLFSFYLHCPFIPRFAWELRVVGYMFSFQWSRASHSSHFPLLSLLFILITVLISFLDSWILSFLIGLGPERKEEEMNCGLVSFLRSSQGSQTKKGNALSELALWVLPRRWALCAHNPPKDNSISFFNFLSLVWFIRSGWLLVFLFGWLPWRCLRP